MTPTDTMRGHRVSLDNASLTGAEGSLSGDGVSLDSVGIGRTSLGSPSRRAFLQGIFSAGAFVIAAHMLPKTAWAQDPGVHTRAQDAPFNPSVYLGIETDGTVYLVTHRSEMGTGIRTSLPLVAADELGADWSRVRIEQALGDAKYGDQNTDGSRSMRDFYEAFRRAGAAARTMLTSAAAAQWAVPAAECEADNHEIVHRASGRRLPFAALVAAAARLPVPAPETLRFKPRTAWTFVGKDTSIYDLSDIITGKAQFGLDTFRDGMVYASIEHPPVVGGTIRSLDDSAARRVRGVLQTIRLDAPTPPLMFKPLGGVAVIADSTWAALQGRRQLAIEWNDGPNGRFDSEAFGRQLVNTVTQPARAARNLGDVDAVFAAGGRTLEATYTTPMAAHAAMEPPAAVAEYRDGAVTVWTATQNPQAVQETVAQALGIDKTAVTCHVTLLGGGFGRKSKPDYAAEAAILARAVGRPVKVVWTREDDIRFDFYHAAAAVYHKAVVDGRGRPTAWLQRSAFQPIQSTFEAGARYPGPFELDLGLTDLPYDVPNLRAENGPADANVRIGWFRAVTNNFHVFAAGSFADELAQAAGRDPLEFLLDMLGPARILDLTGQGFEYSNYGAPYDRYPIDTGRLRRVLEMAGERAGWANRPRGNGRGMGIAAHRSFNTYVASVVEVAVDAAGQLTIPRVVQVADAGLIVNPDRVRAQFEGAAVMAVSLARFGEITAANGRIEQSNFHDFRVARMGDAPRQVDVHLIESDEPPTGVGEPGVPPVIAALANAVFAATGKRVRDLPLSKTPLA
ncbi:MAG: molybdopterin cofactor-binding domain-containing protein [Vicinamibacterales bacterium]